MVAHGGSGTAGTYAALAGMITTHHADLHERDTIKGDECTKLILWLASGGESRRP
jgi:hypothetical protein